jgi:hypothetical protein
MAGPVGVPHAQRMDGTPRGFAIGGRCILRFYAGSRIPSPPAPYALRDLPSELGAKTATPHVILTFRVDTL